MTDKLKQAAQQALEALEIIDRAMPFPVGKQIITALKAALAQEHALHELARLTEEAVGFECRKHFWMHGTRFEDAYMAGFRDAEAAHGIKENT